MRHYKLIPFLCLTILVGCAEQGTQPSSTSSDQARLLISEGSSTSGGLSVSNGNVIVIEDQPGIAFATVVTPGASRKIAYFLIFNHDLPGADVKTESGGNDLSAQTFHTISAFGNEYTVRYNVDLKEATSDFETESISYGGVTDDLSEGRVFLVNLQTNPPKVTRLKLDLPTDVPSLSEAVAVEQFGRQTLSALRQMESRVDEFCRAIEASE